MFKANSAILNCLLTLLNERVFDNGDTRIEVPLKCAWMLEQSFWFLFVYQEGFSHSAKIPAIPNCGDLGVVAASNELFEGDELAALHDRFLLSLCSCLAGN